MLATNAAVGAWRKEWQQSTLVTDLTYSSYVARLQRYAVYWAFFKNNAYSDVNLWAKDYRVQNKLYRHVRNIYNPARRLCVFWETALYGGPLDPNAGDGSAVKSALPILTKNELLRPALARLWRDSNMQARKEEYALLGTVFGDVGWRVCDDPGRGKVFITPLHAQNLYDVVRDEVGNVKGYTYIETRPDPRVVVTAQAHPVMYIETATRDGAWVLYQTFLNKDLYAWDGVSAAWAEPYGFVPLVVVKHAGVSEWGESEIEGNEAKIREADDMASLLHDYIRKAVNAPMLLAGVNAPEDNSTPTAKNRNTSDRNTAAGTTPNLREEVPLFYGPTGANAIPLIAPLDLVGAGARIDKLIEELESDNPELKIDKLRVSGGLTGRALELAREPAEQKGVRLRGNYDNGLVRAHQMALAIGGWRGYDGYQGFDLDSYARGVLDHSIGPRAIFSGSEMDKLEIREKFWQIVTNAGPNVGNATVLRDLGWSDSKIEEELGTAPPAATPPTASAAGMATDPLLNDVHTALKDFRAAMGTSATQPVAGAN